MVRAVLAGELPDYARELVSEAARQTGYPLVVMERDGLGYDSQVCMAGPNQPYHVLAYVPHYRQFSLHFIVNAAVKIRRFFEEPPEERLMAVSKAGSRLPAGMEAELRRKLRNPPGPVLAGLS